MKDLMLNQESFVRDSISIRLKNLAAHLNQIGVQVSDVTPATSTITLIRESLYFIEWTVPHLVDIDVDTAAALVDLGRTLTRWLFSWEKIRSDTTAVTQVQTEINSLSQRVLEMSGLLSESISEAC
jgi:hypothetical protein